MKMYIAGRWRDRDMLAERAEQLEKMGHSVTSRWLIDDDHHIRVDNGAFNDALAHHDISDLRRADAIVYAADSGSRGGSHVEFGMAIAWDKDLIMIGECTHVFTYYCKVLRYKTWEDFFEAASTESYEPHLKAVPTEAEICEGD